MEKVPNNPTTTRHLLAGTDLQEIEALFAHISTRLQLMALVVNGVDDAFATHK